jgi:hypothetical protein
VSGDDPLRVIGYNIYQTTDPGLPKGQWGRLNDEPLPDPEFTQDVSRLEPGVTYYTYVTSVYASGAEGEPSGVLSATMPEGGVPEEEWPEELGGGE